MKKKILLILLAIIAFVFVDTIVLDAFLDKNADNAQIEKVLAEQCECTIVEKGINGNGFSLPDGVYGDFHNFILSNCNFTDFDKYVEDLNKNLEYAIPNFEEADLVRLSFEIAPNEDRIVSFRNSELTIEK
jgi:hypothetical protein